MSQRHVRFGYGTFAAACAAAALSLSGIAHADTINVPVGGDIQSAINGASNGDVIQLEAGNYLPAATLDTNGKAISIIGATDSKSGAPTSIIDGQASIRVLRCTSGEDESTVFENLLITGGYTSSSGGGMFNSDSSPTLTNCTFEGNSIDGESHGGGMYNYDSSPTLTNCTFEGNSADDGGNVPNHGFSVLPSICSVTFTYF